MSWDSQRIKAYDAGLCWRCKRRPHRPNRVLCAPCADKQNERDAAKHARVSPLIRRGRERRCGVCGEAGHYKRRCPRRAKAA